MEKLYYTGLLFLNFAVLNIILSIILFIISLVGKRVLSSPYIKSRLFFISLAAPPVVAAFTVVTSFIPPFFVKLHDGPMLCVNEPYCYIFSLIPEFPMFSGAVIAAVVLVLLSILYSIVSFGAYFRMGTVINRLPALSYDNGMSRDRVLGTGGLRVKVIDTPLMISFVWGYISNFIVISTGTLKSLSPDELKCLFAHEISHYRRRDNVLKGILLLCRNTLFIFPHIHYIFRWWKETIELIGDEAAVLSTGKPLDVASAILKMQNKSASERDWNIEQFATGFSATAHTETLTKRVERLVAINDSKLVPGNARCSFIPSETGIVTVLIVMFPILFAVVYEIDPLMLHCYLEKITSLL